MTTPGSDPRYDALAELAMGTMTDEERVVLEQWVASEPAAQAQLRALREAVATLAVAVPQVEPPAHLRARVLAVAGHAPPTPAEGRIADMSAPADRRGAVAPTRTRAASPLPWLAAAAAAVIALGAGAYAVQLRGEVRRLQSDLRSVETRLAAAEAEARDSRTRLVRAPTETAILSAPDLRRVDLAGQQGAPQAVARAFWSRAQGLVFTAARLPGLPQGRTYQLWVLTSGAPVSAGVFAADASGGVSAVFDTPVSLPTPTGMAVSVEPAGGVPAPTGDIVLAGKAD